MRKNIIFMTTILLLFSSVMTVMYSQTAKKDTLTAITIGEPDTFDVHYAYDNASGEIIYNVYDSLLEYKSGTVTAYEPRLSTNVPSVKDKTITDGGKTYIFNIRKGVKFQNGNALTPEDVEYTFERALVLSADGSPMWMYLNAFYDEHKLKDVVEKYMGKEWEEIFDADNNPKAEYKAKLIQFYKDKIDPVVEVKGDQVIFKLAKPFAPFRDIIAQYAYWSAIIDKEWSIEQGLWDGKADGWWKYHNTKKEDSPIYTQMMGTGPYKMVEWDRTQKKVILERFDGYWRGPAKIKRVVRLGINEWSTRKAMFERDEADIIYTDSENLSQAKSLKNVKIYDGLNELSLNSAQFNWDIDRNSKYIGSGKLDGNGIPVKFFEDKNVRLGFIHAFDNFTFIEKLLDNQGKTTPTCLIDGLLGYNEKLSKNSYDPKKAESYFKKAYRGKLWSVGFKMTLLYNSGNSTRQKAAELWAEGLKKINPKFQVEVKGVEWPTYLDAIKNSTLTCYFIGWGADYPDPNNFVFTFYHSDGDYGDFYGANFEEYAKTERKELSNMSLNQIIEEAFNEVDPKSRIKLYDKIQKFIIQEGIGMPLVQLSGFITLKDYVKGFVFNPMRNRNDFEYYQLSK